MMLRTLLAATLLAATLLTSSMAAAAHAAPNRFPSDLVATDSVPGEIIVRFKSNAGGSDRAAARRAARVTAKKDMLLSRTQLVRAQDGQSVAAALAALRRDGRVMYATPNRIYQATATTPDDSRYGELWGLHNSGQTVGQAGKPDADIDAPEAWDLFKNAPSVVVAVADTGVRYDHPDLDGNMWTNAGDPPGGGDQDNNGYVDDTRGWDFVDDDNDPIDLESHGTHVAGTIAAEGNNAFGSTGVAWDAQIMAVRVLDENGSGTGQAIMDGFHYAANNGAKVVNASLGGRGDASDEAFYDAIFGAHTGTTLFVVAAGNDGTSNETVGTYPCNSEQPNVVCVAATDNQDAVADFSNFGATEVDLGAPGVSILSSVPKWASTGKSDDFATGLDGWSDAGSLRGSWSTWTHSVNPTGAYLGEDAAAGVTFKDKEDLIIEPVGGYDLAGKSGCVMAWDYYWDFDFQKDGMFVETSIDDGQNWAAQQVYTGTSPHATARIRRLNLKRDNQTVRVRFHTIADDMLGPRDGYLGSVIDNFRVQCITTPDASSYQFFQGTSMATPHVAGVATLLFGAKPSASVAAVRGWLLDSGDQIESLNGITVTGRRLNALKALQAAGLGQQVTPPDAVTGAAADITQTTATISGTVDPNGTETAYKFVYGTAPDALNSQVPMTPASVGAGTAPVNVSQPLTGLSAGTTYHYKLVAVQGATETSGATQSFQTATAGGALPPVVTMAAASAVGATTATLVGTVNPNGKATTFYWEYGTSAGNLNAQTPTLSAGNGDSPVDLRVGLVDLQPNTTYHYRLRATNADGSAGATATPLTFTTGSLPAGPQGPAGQDGTDGTNGSNGAPGAPGANGTNGTNGTNGAAGPAGPAGPQGPAGAPGAKGLVTCKVTGKKRKPKVTCKVSYSTAARASVRISRAGRLVARGSARRMTKGRALRMRTLRRVSRGRYRLQVTLVERSGAKTTLTSTIRL